jgi:putative membrane protein
MKTRAIIAIILSILLVIFTIQNIEIVTVRLFFWNPQIPRALLILICICIGIIIGALIPGKKKNQKGAGDNNMVNEKLSE